MNYLIAYAKISIDKEEGIELQGIYFGGISDTEKEADEIATECVNISKGGTILPTILKLNAPEDLLDTMDIVNSRFETKTKQMREANEILTKSSRTSRRSKKSQIKKLLD